RVLAVTHTSTSCSTTLSLHDALPILPDIMTIGKGMAGGFPVSGVVTSTEIAESKPFANPSGSSSSNGGNPLASAAADAALQVLLDRKSTRLNSSHVAHSYDVFCLKKK